MTKQHFVYVLTHTGKTLPKVSYIKVSEVWFLGCTLFIFGSLLEFAFVNTIWRRKSSVNVKSMSSKHILKSTLSPNLSRRKVVTRKRSTSFSLDTSRAGDGDGFSLSEMPKFNNYLTIHNFPITTIKEVNEKGDNVSKAAKFATTAHLSEKMFDQMATNKRNDGTTLTPQEISQWIDAKARVLFPLSFLIFNLLFWTFVYIF